MPNVPDDMRITDELAVELSREALKREGLDLELYSPEPYWNSSNKLFAENAYNKNSGYILWRYLGEPRRPGYTVRVEKHGKNIYCDAGRNK